MLRKILFEYALHEKLVKNRKASAHWSATRNKERPSSCYVVNSSTARQPRVDYIVIAFSHKFAFAFLCSCFRGGVQESLSLVPWRARETVVSWANRPAGVPSRFAAPLSTAPPCAAPPRAARGLSQLWIRQAMVYVIVCMLFEYLSNPEP